MILVFTIFYKLFYDFKRWIRCFYTILIILNPNFGKKKKKKKTQSSAFRLIKRKVFANLIYIDSKIYNVNAFPCTHEALQVLHLGSKTKSRKTFEFPIYITVGCIITNLWVEQQVCTVDVTPNWTEFLIYITVGCIITNVWVEQQVCTVDVTPNWTDCMWWNDLQFMQTTT